MDVKIKDRDKKIEQLRLALAMVDIGVSYPTCDLLADVMNTIDEKDGEFSIKDAAEIKVVWEKRWDKYFNEQKTKNEENG